MDIAEFLGIGVVGGLLSVAVELIKNKFYPDSWQTKLIVIALSVTVGTVYWWLRSTPYFETVIGILAAASTVYALLLKR